jgi:hypothetical protein
MSQDQGTPQPPADGPPPKMDPAVVAYGWLVHIHEMVEHAMRDVELRLPEDADTTPAVHRARARAGAFHLGLDYGVPGFGLAGPAEPAGSPE